MKKRALRVALLFLALSLLAGLILLWGPGCVILDATGYYCAGCGTQRMIAALLRGDLSGAARQNIFMLIMLPLAGLFLLTEALRYIRGKQPLWRGPCFSLIAAGILALSILFTVLRNLPGFQWLAPVPV